ncbi:unnamed protein product [Paramecium octaurelia]|uniref:Uncharacterized protein n=1 Tax=Paramecium octaurelia TaxID=43137 RepID=A0A8S1VY14_PAROT|nr:unnamed protein product [Paramecium octaurelia]
MGCAFQKKKYLKNSEGFQFRQKQLQPEEQSGQQMTKSPLCRSTRTPSTKNSKTISREQQIRIEKLLFGKRRSTNTPQCLEEEYIYQRTIIGLIAN